MKFKFVLVFTSYVLCPFSLVYIWELNVVQYEHTSHNCFWINPEAGISCCNVCHGDNCLDAYMFLLQVGPSGITGTVLIANLLTEKNSLILEFLQGN